MTTKYRQFFPWQQPDVIAQELINTWGEDGFIWLDGDNSNLGRWITLAVDPIEQVCCRGLPHENSSRNPFEALRSLKPGHWTGWLSYEAGAWIEPSNPWKSDEMAMLWIASHDPVVKFDLKEQKLWIEGNHEKRFKEMSQWLSDLSTERKRDKTSTKIAVNSWHSLTTKIHYTQSVKNIKNWINEGDIFQANLANCFTTNIPKQICSLEIYKKLRNFCPAPFGGMMVGKGEAKHEAIMSVSPERFLKVLPNGVIETRPIKGTRPRYSNKKKDSAMAIELVCSTKDRAENIMVVDLLRNDLGKVCIPGSIHVSQLVALESYSQVHHLTSVIKGCLSPDKTWIDLLEACWPGGSITGAPKLRACQRLFELEKKARGPYCGSFLHLNWDNTFNSNILIRSIMKIKSTLKAYAGCGIIAESDPDNEYEEMNWKLLPLLKALDK